jgi:hypothetical protein
LQVATAERVSILPSANAGWKVGNTNGSTPVSVFGSRLKNHKKLTLSTQHLRPSRWAAKPYRRQLRFNYIIKISSRPIFDVENDYVVARLRYSASIDVSTAISKASIFGRFSWRRQLSSTIYGNNRFMTPPDHNLHYVDIYGR